ncbi:MAG: serine--tRNA ligase [Gammaproteobacteria bacterium]|nr:MAG: serine--tRNA ligase [Gammaproteobacteria bacterium]
MIDINLLRADPEKVKNNLKIKNYDLDSDLFIEIDSNRKTLQTEVEDLKGLKNKLSKDFGELKRNNQDTSELSNQLDEIKKNLFEKEELLNKTLSQLNNFLLDIPNIPHQDVEAGNSEEDNKVIKTFGDVQKKDSIDHLEITSDIDTESAVKLAGTRFAVLKDDIAKLQRALISFMLDVAEKNGYEERYVPFMANSRSLTGTGQLPKFEEDLFKITEDLFLIPTAEVPLTNLYADSILEQGSLPIKVTSHTPCFRSEAGSYGKDTKGLIRQHQFEKVEIVQIVHPNESDAALEGLLSNAEEILQLLELPYQVVQLCGGDLGFSSAKTYDIEVWIPSQNKYREISSCSNFTDFQSRRSKIRLNEDGNKILPHTLNGSALAVGRTLVAIIENFYDEKNSIRIPKPLQKYLNKDVINCN